MADAQLVENDDGSWLLQGELGSLSVPSVLQHAGVNMLGKEPITVDLKGVTRADSAGLALLVEWLRESESAGNQYRICECAGAVAFHCARLRAGRYPRA